MIPSLNNFKHNYEVKTNNRNNENAYKCSHYKILTVTYTLVNLFRWRYTEVDEILNVEMQHLIL